MNLLPSLKSAFLLAFVLLAGAASATEVPTAPSAASEGVKTETPPGPLAELVGTKTEDGVPLFGLHYSPKVKSNTVVIHVPGGPGAFASAQDMAPLATALTRQGFHFLSFNLRTAGANGMFYAKSEDYPLDVKALVSYAKSQGLTNIILLGHSLSSARVFYYLSLNKDPAIKGVIVSSGITSPYLESQMRWDQADRAKYDAFLAARREDIKAGRGKELSSYPWGGPKRVFEFSAATWVDVFGTPQESNSSTVKFGKDITVPVLVVHGTQDPTSVPKNAEEILASLVNSPKKELVWIEGGNHLFIGSADKYAQVVSDWVTKNFGNTLKKTAHK